MSLLNPAEATTVSIKSSSSDAIYSVLVWPSAKTAVCECAAAKHGRACRHQDKALELAAKPTLDRVCHCDESTGPQEARRRELETLRTNAPIFAESDPEFAARLEAAASFMAFLLERDFPTQLDDDYDEATDCSPDGDEQDAPLWRGTSHPDGEQLDTVLAPAPRRVHPLQDLDYLDESDPFSDDVILHPLAVSLLRESGVLAL